MPPASSGPAPESDSYLSCSYLSCCFMLGMDNMRAPLSISCTAEIMQSLKPGHQTLLFSATMPVEIEALANQYLTKPVTVKARVQDMHLPDVRVHWGLHCMFVCAQAQIALPGPAGGASQHPDGKRAAGAAEDYRGQQD